MDSDRAGIDAGNGALAGAVTNEVDIWRRANITSQDLGQLRRANLRMCQALVRIQELAQAEIDAGVVTSRSRIPEIIETVKEVL